LHHHRQLNAGGDFYEKNGAVKAEAMEKTNG
jgi:hypothetical protein